MSGMNITSNDLIQIIKACGESHVESLECGEIKLKFYNSERPNQNETIALSQDVKSLVEVGQDDPSQSFTNLDESNDDSREINEDILAQLSIEDPVMYEDLYLRKLSEEG